MVYQVGEFALHKVLHYAIEFEEVLVVDVARLEGVFAVLLEQLGLR